MRGSEIQVVAGSTEVCRNALMFSFHQALPVPVSVIHM